jgi:hypothetical protein
MDRPTLQKRAGMTRAVNDLITSMAGSIAEHGIGIEKLAEPPLPVQDRARHHAHHQASARCEEHHESRKSSAVVTGFVDKLRSLVGDKGLIADDAGKHPYLTDWRENYLGSALAVARPATTEEVAAVVRLCAAEKVAIVPQGGNTGMAGGGTPHESGREIVLSLTRMNRILDIDTIGYAMTVEAACRAQGHPGGRGGQ